MKIAYSLFIIITSLGSAKAQLFEGKIIYKNEYKSKVENLSSDQFAILMGNTQEYFLKGGYYKSVTNGTLALWQMYNPEENKLYFKMNNVESIFWNDGAVNADNVVKAEINKNALDVMGQMCDELILTCTNGVQKYYFNTSLQIDWKLFENHKYGNWNEVVSRTKSLPLKAIVENQQFIMTYTSIKIMPMQIDKAIFELPAGIPLVKNPY